MPELHFDLALPADIPTFGFIGLKSRVIVENDRMVFFGPRVIQIVEIPRELVHACPWAHARNRDELLGRLGFPSVRAWLQEKGSDVPWN
jgi:hypothetical protein